MVLINKKMDFILINIKQKNRYILSIIDHSKKVWVYLQITKEDKEISENFKDFIESNGIFHILYSGNGKEFGNDCFKNFFQNENV